MPPTPKGTTSKFKRGQSGWKGASTLAVALNKYGTECPVSEDNADPLHAVPPAASGPAGAVFEGKVGAFIPSTSSAQASRADFPALLGERFAFSNRRRVGRSMTLRSMRSTRTGREHSWISRRSARSISRARTPILPMWFGDCGPRRKSSNSQPRGLRWRSPLRGLHHGSSAIVSRCFNLSYRQR